MRKRWKSTVAAALLCVIALPILGRQVWPIRQRPLEGASLSETQHRQVRFRNEADKLEMAGLLFVPAGEGPFPAAVFIHGSGTSRRDNPWYLTLAEYLRRQGVLVLLPDKRGSEQSQGNWRTSSFEALAGDTVAAIEFLKNQSEVPIHKIGIIGMSQGGHIAPLVADRSRDVSFVVNVVGSAVTMRRALLYEENHNLRQMGVLPGLSNLMARLSAAYLVNIGQRDFWTEIGDYDPLPYWRKLAVPALVLYGSDDTNVDTEENAALLRSLGKPNIEVTVYDGSGHALEDPVNQGDRIFRDDAMQEIRDFIRASSTSALRSTD